MTVGNGQWRNQQQYDWQLCQRTRQRRTLRGHLTFALTNCHRSVHMLLVLLFLLALHCSYFPASAVGNCENFTKICFEIIQVFFVFVKLVALQRCCWWAISLPQLVASNRLFLRCPQVVQLSCFHCAQANFEKLLNCFPNGNDVGEVRHATTTNSWLFIYLL